MQCQIGIQRPQMFEAKDAFLSTSRKGEYRRVMMIESYKTHGECSRCSPARVLFTAYRDQVVEAKLGTASQCKCSKTKAI